MYLSMPDMDGLEACRRIRSEARLEHLPVIVVTAKTDASDLTAAYTAGATDYIRKPVIPAELVARVSMAMSLKEEYDNREERERELDAKLNWVDGARTALRVPLPCAKWPSPRRRLGNIEDYLEKQRQDYVGVCTVER
jgi:DNA-binding response OmpR family regulator